MNCGECEYPIEHDDALFCPECASPLNRDPAPEIEGVDLEGGVEQSPAPELPQENSVPFENAELPLLKRYLATCSLALMEPRKLFSNMNGDSAIGPMIFGVVTATIGLQLSLLWPVILAGLSEILSGGGTTALTTLIANLIFTAPTLVLAPIPVLLGLFFWAGLFHLSLMMSGTQPRSFERTLRAVAYATPPLLFAILPSVGPLLGFFWMVPLSILAAQLAHGIDGWRAALAYLAPLLACLGGLLVLWSILSAVLPLG